MAIRRPILSRSTAAPAGAEAPTTVLGDAPGARAAGEAPHAARSGWRDPYRLGVVLVLLVAAGLRLWGIRHGMPYAYNLDERSHFVPKAIAMTGGDLNPHYFINPPGYTYLLAGLFAVLWPGGSADEFARNPEAVWVVARLVSVALGVGAVAATYAAGRAWFDRRAGLFAAAVMAVAFLPVFYSRLGLNDGAAVLPCALGLWAAAAVMRSGSLRAFAAAGACVGLATVTKYSDGVIGVALAVAALLALRSFGVRRVLIGLVVSGAAAIAAFLVLNPYALLDHAAFLSDIDRQRKYASGPPLIGQVERSGWAYYVTSLGWALGVVPAMMALGGLVLLAIRRRPEVLVLGLLAGLFWLYMGSQNRFYARWILPVYPALALLAGYFAAEALAAVRGRLPRGGWPVAAATAVLTAVLIVPTALPTVSNARLLTREDTRSETRAWLVANVPAGTKVVFEPIAPREWYGRSPGAGPKASTDKQFKRFNRSPELIRELAKSFKGARRKSDFQNYERTISPALLPVYRRLGYCWIVSGSTQYGRAYAQRGRGVSARAYYKALRASARVAFRTTPVEAGATLPRYQIDRSFNYADGAYRRPGPEMIVYRLQGGRCGRG